MKRWPADRLVALLLAAVATAYLLPLRNLGLSMNDDGWWLQAVLRMRGGEVLYRDVSTFYAPGIYHAIELLFDVTGASFLAARTLFAMLLVAAVVMTYWIARRFAPPSVAWIPAAVYGLVPGPWHKAYYGACSAAVLLCLARAVERPRPLRFAVLGLVAGLTFVTRQDLGMLAVVLSLGAAALPLLWPASFGASGRSVAGFAARAGALLGGVAVPVAAIAAVYAPAGALPELYDATLVRAFTQMGAHKSSLGTLLGAATFAMAPEGRAVGVLMIAPLVLYPLFAGWAALRVLRGRIDAETVIVLALLAFGAAALAQSYNPMLLLRFLQSALPFYLLATIGAWWLHEWLVQHGSAKVAALPVVALAALGALHVGLVWFGLPGVHQPLYTGSARMLQYQAPVEVLGESFRESFPLADEIRLVRAFYDANTQPDEPTLALPFAPLYNPILGRRNPTRFLADHPTGNFTMSAADKRGEASRLLASGARFAIVDQRWSARPDGDDPLLEALRSAFHPVRGYGSVLILERGNDAEWTAFRERLEKTIARGPDPADIDAWREFAEAHPQEPLAWRMLAIAYQGGGRIPASVAALHRAADLDPADASPLEASAGLLIASQRGGEAVADLARARAVRESPETRRIAAILAAMRPKQRP